MKKTVAMLMTAAFLAGFNLLALATGDDEEEKNETNTTLTTSLKGQVRDEDTGEALTGVKLKVKGEEASTYTDFEGNFSFQGLKPGKYQIKTSFISYKDELYDDITLEMEGKNEVVIRMEPIEK
ncbi:MAG: carboxypeptidase regulatory-like domain-containing protein [Bacteroidales bacterium]